MQSAISIHISYFWGIKIINFSYRYTTLFIPFLLCGVLVCMHKTKLERTFEFFKVDYIRQLSWQFSVFYNRINYLLCLEKSRNEWATICV